MNKLIPLAPGVLAISASKELERQIADLVPAGKTGAVITVVDKDGIEFGVGLAHTTKRGLRLTVTAEVRQAWRRAPPDASLKIKAVF